MMTKHTNCDKLILAVLQGEDYYEAIAKLNEHGFYATILQSNGGFLRKKNVTVMIGVNHDHLEEALELLKQYGVRTETQYQTPAMRSGIAPIGADSIPIPVQRGGVVLFVLNVERNERY